MLVVRVLCKIAKAAGRPYTLTLLPAHLVPRERVSAPDFYETVGRYLAGRGSQEEGADRLGYAGPKPFRRLLRLVRKHLHTAAIRLREEIGALGGSIPGRAFRPRRAPRRVREGWQDWCELVRLGTIYLACHNAVPGLPVVLISRLLVFLHCRLWLLGGGIPPPSPA